MVDSKMSRPASDDPLLPLLRFAPPGLGSWSFPK